MDKSLRIHSTKSGLFLFFPDDKRYIITKNDPFFAYIFEPHWISKQTILDREYLQNYFNLYISKEEFDESGIHIISPKYWMNKPSIKSSFYGLVGFEDCATFSDLIKGACGAKIHITPEMTRLHNVFLLSHPIDDMSEISSFQHLEKVCLSSQSPSEKSKRLFTLLG